MEMELKNSGDYNNLKVEASYAKGGMNYFNGNREPKGMYISVAASEVSYSRGFKSEAFLMFDDSVANFKFFLFPMGRDNKKKVAAFNAALDGLDGEAVAALFEADNKKAIVDVVKLVLGVPAEVAA